MRLRTRTQSLGFICESVTETNVSHSVKKTYKGSKIARVQNKVDDIQAGALDRAEHWKRKKEERRNRRKGIS